MSDLSMDLVGKYEVKKFSKNRKMVFDLLDLSSKKHHVKALFEVDVTKGREFIRKHEEKTGEKLSFSAWMIKCIGNVVSEFKEMNAIRKGKRKVYYFDDIDIAIIVERNVGGKLVPTKYFMKKVNEKTFREINDEIRTVQSQKLKRTGYTEKPNKFMELFIAMPKFLRKIIWGEVKRNPVMRKKHIGAITVSSIGKYADQGGWGIVHSFETSHFMIGGIAKKPVVIDDKIEIREILNLTVMVDHYIMDGGPFTKFLRKLANLIKDGGCLDGV